jgi:hypothetical protein
MRTRPARPACCWAVELPWRHPPASRSTTPSHPRQRRGPRTSSVRVRGITRARSPRTQSAVGLPRRARSTRHGRGRTHKRGRVSSSALTSYASTQSRRRPHSVCARERGTLSSRRARNCVVARRSTTNPAPSDMSASSAGNATHATRDVIEWCPAFQPLFACYAPVDFRWIGRIVPLLTSARARRGFGS